MNYPVILTNKDWTFEEIIELWKSHQEIQLSPELISIINSSRSKLEHKLQDNDAPIYGINTGFGALCNSVISDDELDQLQINLVRSHACGSGKRISNHLVKLIVLLKIIGLSKSNSCIRLDIIQFLISLYNKNLFPVIPEFGSLGASGDLAPLAHLSLSVIGEGKLIDENGNEVDNVKSFFKKNNIQIPMLKAKEGLALLNGTQYSLARLIENLYLSKKILDQSLLTLALSMEAFNCSMDFLHPEIHGIRKQLGQIEMAKKLNHILRDSELHTRKKNSVQDPYSFRCVPQVLGASYDTFQHVQQIAVREINSVTDNPLMLSDGSILSGGNFHAQPLALCSDFLSIAISELGNISERRIYQLINGSRDLPDFLTQNPGLNSGYMIVQYSAASLVSMNKQMCSPSSVDSIVTSKGQEDHVSMAANAGIKSYEIVKRVQQVIAMEWMTATRAWEYRKLNWKLSNELGSLVNRYRSLIPFQEQDYIPSSEYIPTIEFMNENM